MVSSSRKDIASNELSLQKIKKKLSIITKGNYPPYSSGNISIKKYLATINSHFAHPYEKKSEKCFRCVINEINFVFNKTVSIYKRTRRYLESRHGNQEFSFPVSSLSLNNDCHIEY